MNRGVCAMLGRLMTRKFRAPELASVRSAPATVAEAVLPAAATADRFWVAGLEIVLSTSLAPASRTNKIRGLRRQAAGLGKAELLRERRHRAARRGGGTGKRKVDIGRHRRRGRRVPLQRRHEDLGVDGTVGEAAVEIRR